MSTLHNTAHEPLLEDLLLGEDVDAVALDDLRRCDRCAGRLLELRATSAALAEALAAERAAVLDQAARAAVPLEDEVERLVLSLPLPQQRATVRRRALAAVIVLALAGAVLAIALRPPPADRAPHHSGGLRFLAGDSIVLLEPLGEAPSFAKFAWRATLPPGGSFTVTIYPAKDGADSLITSEAETAPTWSPSQDLLQRLPAAIRWQVSVIDATGQVVAEASAQASRSR